MLELDLYGSSLLFDSPPPTEQDKSDQDPMDNNDFVYFNGQEDDIRFDGCSFVDPKLLLLSYLSETEAKANHEEEAENAKMTATAPSPADFPAPNFAGTDKTSTENNAPSPSFSISNLLTSNVEAVEYTSPSPPQKLHLPPPPAMPPLVPMHAREMANSLFNTNILTQAPLSYSPALYSASRSTVNSAESSPKNAGASSSNTKESPETSYLHQLADLASRSSPSTSNTSTPSSAAGGWRPIMPTNNSTYVKQPKKTRKNKSKGLDSENDDAAGSTVPKNKFPDQIHVPLRAWLKNNAHDPYPTMPEKHELVEQTGLSMRQVNDWFINNRRRMLKAGSYRTRKVVRKSMVPDHIRPSQIQLKQLVNTEQQPPPPPPNHE